jgi:glutathione S-transferase
MMKLIQFPLCPFSRSIRMALTEQAIPFDLVDERPWEWRPTLLALNPAGELPVLQLDDRSVVCGVYAISEFLAEHGQNACADNRGVQLFPGSREQRAEVRRLVDWFHRKMDREVTRELLELKVQPRFGPDGKHSPHAQLLRAIASNLRYHLSYVGFLSYQRRWLAGDAFSFADLAAAAHVSCIDYLGEIAWDEHPRAREWYSRVKSRPALRLILADRIPGAPPPPHYADLDF